MQDACCDLLEAIFLCFGHFLLMVWIKPPLNVWGQVDIQTEASQRLLR